MSCWLCYTPEVLLGLVIRGDFPRRSRDEATTTVVRLLSSPSEELDRYFARRLNFLKLKIESPGSLHGSSLRTVSHGKVEDRTFSGQL